MQSFDTNQTIDWQMPKTYRPFLTQEEYEVILNLALEQIRQKGEIVSAANGEIKALMPEYGIKEVQFFLDNLARQCKSVDRSEWEGMIATHFQKFPINQPKSTFLQKDLDHAKSLLRVSVKPEQTAKNLDEQWIKRVDFPGTFTFLVLDTDDAFQFVRSDTIEWEASPEELFQMALDNVALEPISVQEAALGEEYPIFVFFSGDFSAAFLIELERNASFAIGKLGAVVAIPNKGTAFVHPLESATMMDFVVAFSPMQQQLFCEHQSPITQTFYWYYEGKYEAFPIKMENDEMFISIPLGLASLLNQN